MNRIVVLDGYALNPGDLSWKPFEDFGEVQVYARTNPSDMIQRIANAEIVLTNKAYFTREIFDQLPNLRYIGVMATGYNVIDIAAARAKNITISNIPEYASYATAQMTFALLLEMTNRTARHDQRVHEGVWTACQDFCFWESNLTELWQKTIGIIGYGKIGRRVAAIAQALGMRVLVTSRSIEEQILSGKTASISNSDDGLVFVTLPDLLAQSDIITLHCPLTEDTAGMIDARAISHMKDSVLLVNTSRGLILNETDVADALRSGKIAGAALDVLSTEPPKPDNPLLTAPNCIITPHIAWAPRETRQRLLDTAYANLQAFLSGSPQNVIS